MVEMNMNLVSGGVEVEDEAPTFSKDIQTFLASLKDKYSKIGTKFFVDADGSIECDHEDAQVGFMNTDPICWLAGMVGIAWYLHHDKLGLNIRDAAEIAAASDKTKGYDPDLRNLILEALGLFTEETK